MYGQPTYYPNPALQTAQQRLQMMEAQYPQFATNPAMGYSQPMPQQTSSAVPLLKGRPVSNEEEANAAMIDFDGSLFVFPDKAHGKIYTKQLGLDGNIIFLRYSLEQPSGTTPVVEPSIAMEGYVKVEDLNQRLEEINERFTGLEQRLTSNSSESKGGNRR